MAVVLRLTEGWTKEIGPFTLKIDGVGFPLAPGVVATLVLKGKGRAASDTAGDVRADSDQATYPGRVWWKPDASDMVAAYSPYTVHWKVTDVAGDVAFFPHGEADEIEVFTP